MSENQSGFAAPNHTQTPNILFDLMMMNMGEAELKVTLCAVRKTFGYHKTRDPISLSQFQSMTGLSRQGVIGGIEKAIARGVLKKVGTGRRKIDIYEVVVTSQDSGLVNTVDQSTPLTRTSQRSRPELVNVVDPQKKVVKENRQKKDKDSAPPDSSHQPASPIVAATSAAQSEKPLNPIVIEQINEAVAAGDARPMPLKAKKSKQPDKPKEPAKPRERDRLFDGVAFTCFEVDMNKLKTPLNKNTAKRIGVLVSWLKENEYTPEQLWDFARWYKGTYPDISMPRDAGKLELHWLKWEQSGQPKVTASAALPEYDPTNDPTYRAIPPEQRVDASTIAQRIGARYGKSGL